MQVQTVLRDVAINTSSYTSENLSIGDYESLTVDIDIIRTAASGTCTFSRIVGFSELDGFAFKTFSSPEKISFDIFHFDAIDGSTPNNFWGMFGSLGQLSIISTGTFDATISIKGKSRN